MLKRSRGLPSTRAKMGSSLASIRFEQTSSHRVESCARLDSAEPSNSPFGA